jgi:hypothetical protein
VDYKRIMATIMSAGSEVFVNEVALSTTPAPVTMQRACNRLIVKARGAVAVRIHENQNETAGSKYYTLASGGTLILDITGRENTRPIFWASLAASTDTLEVIGIA